MKLAKKLLILCVMAAMICVPAFADDVSIDMSLLMFGRAALTVYVDGEISETLSDVCVPGDSITLTASQKKLMEAWARLTEEQQAAVFQLIEKM